MKDKEHLFDLTKTQLDAFKKLKQAYRECEKRGIFFVNHYSHLTAYDSKKICGHQIKIEGDADEWVPRENIRENSFYIEIPQEWPDDEVLHNLRLTERGMKIYKGQYE